MADPKRFHIHGESARVGIALAARAYSGASPPMDKIKAILDSIPGNYFVTEFPLQAITEAHREKQDRRRLVALRAMEVLLHKVGEVSLIGSKDIENIALKAWQLAAAMEEQENVSATIDSVSKGGV